MLKRIFTLVSLCCACEYGFAAELSLRDALRATYSACVGIDDELADLKKMAGINTAVTAVGTAAGAGATAVGLVKAGKDKQVEIELTKLREIETSGNFEESTIEDYEAFIAGLDDPEIQKKAREQVEEINKLNRQSKNLGNWRTGLIAGATVTNVAGAIIAGTGQNTDDLQEMINNCTTATANLRDAIGRAQISGEDVSEAREILGACDEYNYVDVSKIANRGKGAMVSSIVGGATGAAGTVTSAIANTDKTRNDNTDEGKQREKNLNTAANVLSGATTVASATATVFNATQISAIKKAASVAEKCTGVLK